MPGLTVPTESFDSPPNSAQPSSPPPSSSHPTPPAPQPQISKSTQPVEVVHTSTSTQPISSPLPLPQLPVMPAGGGNSAHSASNNAQSARPPVTETQILPPPIPPQAMRSSSATTAASTASGASSVSPPAATPTSSSGPPVQTPVPPPIRPVQTPVPAPTPPVQQTPVPAPSIPAAAATTTTATTATTTTTTTTTTITATATATTTATAGSPPTAAPVTGAGAGVTASGTAMHVTKTGTASRAGGSSKTGGGPRSGATHKTAAPKAAAAAVTAVTGAGASSHAKASAKANRGSPKAAFKIAQPHVPSSAVQGLAIQQQQQQPQQQPAPRSWSPPRPPISPILPAAQMPPHLAPTATGSGTFYVPNFATGRPVLTHTEAARKAAEANAAGTAAAAAAAAGAAGVDPLSATPSDISLPPPPLSLDFSNNTDVIALQNTIAILQLQKKRAAADIQELQRAKEVAMANPLEFVQKLEAAKNGAPDASSDEDEDEDEDGQESSKDGKQARVSAAVPDPRRLPKPQNVVRMPPINWNKYAIVGEGLERLHDEQVRRPAIGAPAVATVMGGGTNTSGMPATVAQTAAGPSDPSMGSGLHAVYSFQGASSNTVGPEHVGVAAPYDPLKDRVVAEPTKRGRPSKR